VVEIKKQADFACFNGFCVLLLDEKDVAASFLMRRKISTVF